MKSKHSGSDGLQPVSQHSGVVITHSEEETIELGRNLHLPAQGTVLLIGNLGAGKTTLVKGIAEARGLDPNEVSSPTFTLIQEYGDPVRLYHIDLYRLDTEDEVATLGLEELFVRLTAPSEQRREAA